MALNELAYKGLTDSHSRRSFLKKVGMIGGGVMAMSVVGEGIAFGAAVAQSTDGDVQLVQFAYTLELVAIDAYQTAAKSGLLPPEVVAVGTKFAGQHSEHAAAAKAVLDQMKAKVPDKPTKINYPAFKTAEDILNFALALESAAVGAYYASVGKFSSQDLAAAAASVVGVEATHVALLSAALKKDPIPTAFVTGTKFEDVQATANSLLAPAAGGGTTTPASGGTTTPPPATGGQGGAAPTGAPASGLGGANKSDNDLTGPVSVLSLMAAAGAATLAFTRRKAAKAEATETNEE